MATLGDLIFNPQTGQWEQTQTFDPVENQWSWGENGIMGLGGSPEYAITTDPFFGVQEQYRDGAPIDAETWQDAVRQSLEGFMRTNYGADPIFNFNNQLSGTAGSQYQIGTLQELANRLPGFFNTSGLTTDFNVGGISYGHNLPSYDPLYGLNPDDKLLAFEDIPLEQVERALGGVPSTLFNTKIASPYQNLIRQQVAAQSAYASQIQALQSQLNSIQDGPTQQGGYVYSGGSMEGGVRQVFGSNPFYFQNQQQVSQQRTALQQQIAAIQQQFQQSQQQVLQAQQGIQANAWVPLAQAQQDPTFKDWNDFLFKLDIDQYTPEAKQVVADPKDVLGKFFNTAEYQLAFGSDPRTLDPNLSPEERFKFDPGYEFTQEEGYRQLQNRSASRGLLESGATQRDLLGFGQGLADQNYQRWLGQNVGLFEKWQNAQAQLAAMGPNINGSNQANQLGQNLAQLSGQQGSQMAQLLQQLAGGGQNAFNQLGLGGLSSFSNLGQAGLSSFSNLGTSGLNALTNAGIAQGNNMTQAQIAAAQIQAQQQSQQSQGFGQLAGQLMGGLF
jgi:hypothetical protein